ncbi:MAG: hypothetical protein IJ280_01365 [Bacteroidales bacterium]|nr:hypothetical protein [Bacteroidales bacterium]
MMTPETFIHFLQHPQHLTEKDLPRLEEILRQYPCFAAAKELYLRTLYQNKDLTYESQLFQTSLASPNRSRLFYFVQDKDMQENEQLLSSEGLAPDSLPSDAFDLIDSFLEQSGESLPESSSESSSESTEKQSIESLEQFYATYDVEASLTPASESEPLEDVSFASPEIQMFLDHPQEEIPQEDAEDTPVISSSTDFETEVQSAWESLPNDSLTLTLVKIYLQQKKYARALEILKSLSLNNPEKSVYFADQIRFLEKLLTHLNK